ncbi:hypothetical protein ACR91A_15025, partial [Klebsiella pneumoniae]
TQPATGETYPKSDLFNKAMQRSQMRKLPMPVLMQQKLSMVKLPMRKLVPRYKVLTMLLTLRGGR